MSRGPLELVRSIHEGSRQMRAALLEAVAEDVEFHAPGDPSVLPWAGTFRGPEGLRRQGELLSAHMKYEQFGPHEYFVSEDGREVLVRSATRVRAKATGRVFESSFVRLFTVEDGRVVRVQTWYDTLAYALAMGSFHPLAGAATPQP